MRQVDIKSRSVDCEAGFTLIETSLSMYFIAFLILFLSVSLISLFGTYNKSIWLSNIDQAMRQMRQDIADSAKHTNRSIVLSDHNRFCVGGVSYLWNTDDKIRQANNHYGTLINHWSDNENVALRLVRIKDPSAYYCVDPSAQPSIKDIAVQSLLNGGATIQTFNVKQDIMRADTDDILVPMIHIDGAITTDGINSPIRVHEEGGKLVVVGDDEDGVWQCGDYIDANHNGRRDRGDLFKPNKGRFCANTQVNITVYERGTTR